MRTGRFVVITGAAGGMGRLAVQRFLANGDTVVATDIDGGGLAELAQDARLHTVAGDISIETDCGRVAALAKEVGGRVDVLVNVAGFFPIPPFDEMSAGDFRRVVDINLTGPFLMIKAMTPLLRGRGFPVEWASA